MISVIIPVYQEGQNQIFKDALMLLSMFKNIEVLCIGKGLDYQTKKIVERFPNASYFPTILNSRADRLNDGLKLAEGKFVIFHHPRSRLTRDGLNYLINNFEKFTWGAFKHKFNKRSLFYDFTSWYSNSIRARRGIFYLDHCLFVNLNKLNKNEVLFPHVDIFEDTLFCESLRTKYKPVLLPKYSLTSTIRFERKGIWKQAILNQLMKIAYLLKLSDKKMNKLYEKELELNSSY